MFERAIVEAVILILASGAFAGAFGLWLGRTRKIAALQSVSPTGVESLRPPWAYRLAIVGGIVLAGGLLGWRIYHEGGVILDNHLDVFLLLGLMLAAMLLYFRVTRHLRGLAVFLLPMIALVLLVGGVLALLDPSHKYDYNSMIVVVHVLVIAAGSVCLAAGCVSGVVYLLADRQLRRKGRGPRWLLLPPLAALEKFIAHMVYLGFPLLTVAMVTGFIQAWKVRWQRGEELEVLAPKVVLSVLVWLVYTFLIHVHFAPSFRGRKAAWLSIIGFGLLLGVYFTVTQVRLH